MSDVQRPIADLPEWLASQIIQESGASPPHVRDLPPEPRRPGVASWVAKLAESEQFRDALVELGWRAPDNAEVEAERSVPRPDQYHAPGCPAGITSAVECDLSCW